MTSHTSTPRLSQMMAISLTIAMFTARIFFPFYLAATGALIPVLRFITAPLRSLPAAAGALIALAVGAGLGLLVFTLVTNSELKQFIAGIKAMYVAQPLIGVAVTVASVLGPLLVGLVVGKRDRD